MKERKKHIIMEPTVFYPVGKVINEFDRSTNPAQIKSRPSRLSIDPAFAEALLNIENCEYLDVIFYFHRLEGAEKTLSGKTLSGVERGAFASRTPMRPNLVGVATVKLLEVHGTELIVEGLDALNGSPVLDVKCCDTSLFAREADDHPVHRSILRTEPRMEINSHIASGRTDLLLLKAAQLHGHLCPGLAMGVMAAAYAMRQFPAGTQLRATLETCNCPADGVQFVTGCTLGNKSLTVSDVGQTAFTLTGSDGKSIRLCARQDARQIIDRLPPGSNRALDTLKIPVEELFDISFGNQ
ncbi:MAG: formylmethanofuran dehydrogenase subunit E family protein [Bacteroidales bacterium]|jgi:formylmethanofuran dehydrogenase subunit E|nr:formylmethanofuran dehydrogenase subunit E family protein [Bacteroidales bacterium]